MKQYTQLPDGNFQVITDEDPTTVQTIMATDIANLLNMYEVENVHNEMMMNDLNRRSAASEKAASDARWAADAANGLLRWGA